MQLSKENLLKHRRQISKRYRKRTGNAEIARKMREWRYKTGRCVKAGGSIAEEIVAKKLKEAVPELEIVRRTRLVIKNPVTGRGLELDFYIPSMKLAIEVDGATHRTNCYGPERLEYQKKNDSMKESLCKKQGITLVRIPFGRDINVFCEIAILDLSALNNLIGNGKR